MSQTIDAVVDNGEVLVDQRMNTTVGENVDLEESSTSEEGLVVSEASDPAKAPSVLDHGVDAVKANGWAEVLGNNSLEEAVKAGNEPFQSESSVVALSERPVVSEPAEKVLVSEQVLNQSSEVPEETVVVAKMVVELQGSELPHSDATPPSSLSSSSDALTAAYATPYSATPTVDAAPEAGPENPSLSFAPHSASPVFPDAAPSESSSPSTLSTNHTSIHESTQSSPPADDSTAISEPASPLELGSTEPQTLPTPNHQSSELISLSLPDDGTDGKPTTSESPDTEHSSPETTHPPATVTAELPVASSSAEPLALPESNQGTSPRELPTATQETETTPRKPAPPVSSSSAPDLRTSIVGRPSVSSSDKPASLSSHSGSVGSRMMNLAEETEMERIRAERATRTGRRGAFYAPPPPVFRPKVGADPNEVVKDPALSNSGLVLPIGLVSATSKQARDTVGRRATIGWADTTGKRPTMEDAWVSYSQGKDSSSLDLFGVFDGHRGDSAAKFAAQHLPGAVTSVMKVSKNPSDWLRLGFIQTNLAMKQAGIATGTTAVVGMYWKNIVYLANAGDSRCVHGKVSPTSTIATRMTQDHKPERIDETERIVALGGEVHTSVNKEGKVVGRVNGQLGVSRALGDFDLEPYIIPDPEITQIDLLRPIPIAESPDEDAEDLASSSAVATSSSAPRASSSNSASPSNGNALNTTHPPSRSPSGNTIHNQTITSGSSAHNTSSQLASSSPQATTTFTSSAPPASPMTSSVQPHNPRASSQPSLSPSRSQSASPLKTKPRPTSTSSSKKALKDASEQIEQLQVQPDTSNFDFLILACDGLWDVVTDDEAVAIAAHVLQTGNNPEDAAKRLRNVAFGRGSTDNITVLIVILQTPVSGLKKSSSCIIL